MYTCLFEASKFGGTCFDPLFYLFPNDDKAFEEMNESFMVASALKVSPILESLKPENKTFKSYFPKGTWVNLADPTEVIDTRQKGGDTVDLKTTR
jgi:alpha-glucosidase (family GH31 glycosyl hydrolase)